LLICDRKSSTFVHGSTTPFQSAGYSSQNNVPLCYMESCTNSASVGSIASSELSTHVKSTVVETPCNSEEASLGRRSWSNLDSNEDTESVQSFHSVLPSFEQRLDSTYMINEFAAAADRWRSSERSKDASSQTPVVMTISACVGTPSKMFIDASTNTDFSTSDRYKYHDASTNTEKHDLKLHENIQDTATGKITHQDRYIHSDFKVLPEHSDVNKSVASNSYKRSIDAENDEELVTASGFQTSYDKKHYFNAPVVQPDAFPPTYVGHNMTSLCHNRQEHRSSLLAEFETSEGSVYNTGQTSYATHSPSEKSYKPPPPGLEHITGCRHDPSKVCLYVCTTALKSKSQVF